MSEKRLREGETGIRGRKEREREIREGRKERERVNKREREKER